MLFRAEGSAPNCFGVPQWTCYWPPVVRLPNTRRAVAAGAHHKVPVRAEFRIDHFMVVLAVARVGFPVDAVKAHRVRRIGGDKTLAIRAKRRMIH